MAEDNVIANANDVELVISNDSGSRGTTQSHGRVVADEFSITREEDDSLVSGIGGRHPDGFTNGDITHSFSFTLMGDDVQLFNKVAGSSGGGKRFTMIARRRQNTPDDDSIVWEYTLSPCKATSEELSGSSGDANEYAVDGIAVNVTKKSDTNDVWNQATDTGSDSA